MSTSTPSIGLIIPPPDIQKIILKTSEWIAKKNHVNATTGAKFLEKLRTKQKGQFPFLDESHFYFDYYNHCLANFEEQLRKYGRIEDRSGPEVAVVGNANAPEKGEGNGAGNGSVGSDLVAGGGKAPAATPDSSTAMPPPVISKQHASKPTSSLTKPRTSHVPTTQPLSDPFPSFSNVKIPKDLNEMQLEIIKTTARYVAKNGMQFLGAIAGKHASNPLFDFTKLSHQHFAFFNKLVEVYRKLMRPTEKMLEELRFMADKANRDKLLERLHDKAEWDMIQKEKHRRERERRKEELDAMNAVDWQDFVVVATIDFDPDETNQLAVENENDLEYRAADEDEVEMAPLPALSGSSGEEQPTQPAVTGGTTQQPGTNYVQVGGRMVPIRKDATRRPAQADAERPSEVKYVRDEITGQLIPVDQLQQHMRASLINPQWQEQKKKELEKFQTTNLASNTEMAESLQSLAAARSDTGDGKETREPQRKKAKR